MNGKPGSLAAGYNQESTLAVQLPPANRRYVKYEALQFSDN